MATVKAYVLAMQSRQRAIARKYGCDIGRTSKETRCLNLSLLTLLAVVIKTLTDKGVITDAEILATLDAARDDVWNDEPNELPPLDEAV
jgi:hypothetical protein